MTSRPARIVATLACAVALAGALGACAPVILGGAAVGAMVATDRRTSGAQLEDEGIELRAAGRIRESLGDRVHVNVTSYNRQVLLTGEAPNAQDRQQVEQIVMRVENVRSIVNELGILGNTSLSQRSADTLVTAKIRASMVDTRDIFANAFKVITERGTAYLMGRVTQSEATRATDIARNTSGVQKVVRVFEVISGDELRRSTPPQAQPAAATPPKT